MKTLCRTRLLDDIGGLEWPSAKMLLGVDRPERDPEEPGFFLMLDYSAESKAELKAKDKTIAGIVKDARRSGMKIDPPVPVDDLIKVVPRFADLANLPSRLEFLVDHPGGGLTWVGTYGPLGKMEAAHEAGSAVMKEMGLPPLLVSRLMAGGHFTVLRFITRFDRNNEEEVARAREANIKLFHAMLEHDYVIYKAPGWAVPLLRERMDPGFYELMQKVKAMMDPKGIFSPGCWGL